MAEATLQISLKTARFVVYDFEGERPVAIIFTGTGDMVDTEARLLALKTTGRIVSKEEEKR